MNAEQVYNIYCESATHLPTETTRGEALPAWAFLPTEHKRMWSRIADRVNENALDEISGAA